MLIINRILLTLLFIFIATSCNSQKKEDTTKKEKQPTLVKRQPTKSDTATITTAKNNFVFVKGGTFFMGLESYTDESPVHKVTLSSYSISKYETTFKEFDMYCELNSLEKLKPNWRKQKGMCSNCGVMFLTWQQAMDYCKWLGKQLNSPITLPTEAQWEYAARSRGLDVMHATNSGKIEGGAKDNYGTDREIGSYPPNPLGLYDMSGGRPEWVQDWYANYTEASKVNPVQDTITFSKQKVIRGFHNLYISVYNRAKREPEHTGSGVGFRCVCNKETPIK